MISSQSVRLLNEVAMRSVAPIQAQSVAGSFGQEQEPAPLQRQQQQRQRKSGANKASGRHKSKQPFPDCWRRQRKHEPQVHPGGDDDEGLCGGGSTGPSLPRPRRCRRHSRRRTSPISARTSRQLRRRRRRRRGGRAMDGPTAPHSEDAWRAVAIGACPLRSPKRARCAMIDLDPRRATSRGGGTARKRRSQAGAYALRVLASYRRRHSEILFGRYPALAGAPRFGVHQCRAYAPYCDRRGC